MKLSERLRNKLWILKRGLWIEEPVIEEIAALEALLAAKDAEIARLRAVFDKPVEQGDQYGSYVAICPYQDQHHAALAETPAVKLPKKEKPPEGFWEYLESNLEEVKKWPGWMRGETPAAPQYHCSWHVIGWHHPECPAAPKEPR